MIGYGAIRNNNDIGVVNCIAYSGTQYRLACFNTNSVTMGGYVGSSYFQNSVSGIQINTMLRVPITGWDN
jgi:hypothetical protein